MSCDIANKEYLVRLKVCVCSSVMSAWVRCGQITRAETILDKMEQGEYAGRGEDDRMGTVAPNVVSYTTLMNG